MHNNMFKNPWTPEKTELLKSLWAIESNTASIIQRILGSSFSRNSVIGKARRLGLALRIDPTEPSSGKRARGAMAKRIAMGEKKAFRAPRPMKIVPIKPIEKAIGIIDLKNNTCRWPLEERDDWGHIFYCGDTEADLARGLPYCPFHTKLSTVPLQKWKKKVSKS
jgi:hypothetical protein